MDFSWDEYLPVARRLTSGTSGEADWRSAVSRAYYAVFHCACLLMEAEDPNQYALTKTGKGSHFLVWDWLMKHPKRAFNSAGSYGDELRRRRTDADYHADVGVSFNDASTAIGVAERVYKALNRPVP
jgi:uncharacterized protein (UPF0332 family)